MGFLLALQDHDRRRINDSEIINFADRHSGAMAMVPGGFNPYKIGIELFRSIKERWDKGQFGREWSEAMIILKREIGTQKPIKGWKKSIK